VFRFPSGIDRTGGSGGLGPRKAPSLRGEESKVSGKGSPMEKRSTEKFSEKR